MSGNLVDPTNIPDCCDDIIDLSPQADGSRVIVPVPDHAGTPIFRRFSQDPAHTAPVRNGAGQLIGHLGLYGTDTEGMVLLIVYAEDPIRGPGWKCRHVPRLVDAVAEHNLRERPPTTVVIAPSEQQISSEVHARLKGDYVLVQAAIAFSAGEKRPSIVAPQPAALRQPGKQEESPIDQVPGAASLARHEGPRNNGRAELSDRSGATTGAVSSAPLLALPLSPTEAKADAQSTFARRADRTTLAEVRSRSADAHAETSEIAMIRASDLDHEPLEYLWAGRIARRKLTMMVGDPGLGKSLLAAYLASTVSRGAVWVATGDHAPKGSVVLVSTEDGLSDTIRPRLEAAGADLNAVHLVPDLDLTRNLEALENAVRRIPDLQLIIIDPITSCLGQANLNSMAAVRAAMEPLARFAARAGIAVVFITHLNKSGSRAITRATGSQAFVAVARTAYAMAKDPDDPGRRLLLPLKNNVGADDQGLAFRIESTAVGKGMVPRLVFETGAITISADEALSAASGSRNRRSAGEEAKAFLQHFLAAGAVPALEVQNAAKAEGISPISLLRAKKALGVLSKKSGMANEWQWLLPPDTKMIVLREGDHSHQRIIFAQDDHLRGESAFVEAAPEGAAADDASGDP